MASRQTNSSKSRSERVRLVDEIAELRGEVRVLRDAIDELREVVSWAAKNGLTGSGGNDLAELRTPHPNPSAPAEYFFE